MIDREQIVRIVSDYLSTGETFLVEVAIHPGNRIVVELDSAQGVCIDECVALSRHIESQVDRNIEDYELEVGSAGLTSPLKVMRQWENCIDSELSVLLTNGMKETGRLITVTPEAIKLEVVRMVKPEGAKRKKPETQELTIVMADIKQAVRVI